ncbi:MAG: IPExxxVDY family protein [Cytophagales bacterium]
MSVKKKFELDIEYDDEFLLFGLVTGIKSYTLAWHLNKLLEIKLKKLDDIQYIMKDGGDFYISSYCFSTEHLTFRLLKNKGYGLKEKLIPFLVPEMNKYDFFLHIHGEIDLVDKSKVLSKLRNSDFLTFSSLVETDKMKSKNNFVTLH